MRFQFAFMAVAVLVASLVVADDNLDESKAIEKIELLGGKVTRNDKLPGHPVTGVAFFRQSKHFNGKYLHLLKSFNNLTALSLNHTSITGVGISGLREVSTLRTLSLGGTQITDEEMKELRDLQNLRMLSIWYTQITDEGLKELSELKNLKILNLSSTLITDAGLKELGKLTNLKTLAIMRTQTTDVGVKQLQDSLPNLKIVR